jgi:hypothetical protein
MVRILGLLLSLFSPTPDLDECVQFWQRELALKSWRVAVRVVPRAELHDGTVGDIDTNIHTRTATIRVLHEADYTLKRSQARADQQLTVAHEMVHLSRLHRGDRAWRDEAATITATHILLRRHGRWRELSVSEP